MADGFVPADVRRTPYTHAWVVITGCGIIKDNVTGKFHSHT